MTFVVSIDLSKGSSELVTTAYFYFDFVLLLIFVKAPMTLKGCKAVHRAAVRLIIEKAGAFPVDGVSSDVLLGSFELVA